MGKRRMAPVLKWAGGKTQLLEHIKANLPISYYNYFEPFLGGAAVLLGIAPDRAVVNDINLQLINLYSQIKHSVEDVILIVNELDSSACDKERYYSIRERFNAKIAARELDPECAALMIWINKHCFNGLYRVNRKGQFNVPYNNKATGKSIDSNNLREISEYLTVANVELSCLDFEAFCEQVQFDDFVYFDSPYVSESITASFTDYTQNGFTLKDHERLASLFRTLNDKGAKVMLSNNDVPLVRELYSGFNIHSIDVKRMINRNADKRTGREVLITNY